MDFNQLTTTACALACGFVLAGCASPDRPAPRTQLRLFDHFEGFATTTDGGKKVVLSPQVDVCPWDELLVSWNAECPPGTAVQVEVRAFEGNTATRFYTLAHWSAEPGSTRASARGERDADATLETDTLVCRRLMQGAQVRFTLTGRNGEWPRLKLAAFSFLNTTVSPSPAAPNQIAWGQTVPVPERSQLGHPGASGWCSPASLSMILAHWSQHLRRAELDVPVPEVATNVFDPVYGGTGNWAFNMAYAGSFDGLRAYATRFDDFRQVEDCLAAGIPVALSVSFDQLNGKDQDENNGHLIVVAGLTEKGDVVVNDPWPDPKRANRVRKTFPRDQVINAWQRSKQTVYVVCPESLRGPRRL